MKTTKNWPATLRELGDLAAERGTPLDELLPQLAREIGPFPTPPAGYTMAHGSEDRWTGPEIIKRGWIITPVWDMATNLQTIELWMAIPNLSPDGAIELAADLIAAARAV